MIVPIVGRVVLYFPDPVALHNTHVAKFGDQPMAATVAFVYNERLVNLAVTDHAGVPFAARDVQLLQDDDPAPAGEYCEWMPYQKGQAARTEQLERKVYDQGGGATVLSTKGEDPGYAPSAHAQREGGEQGS